jgi:hypothetical protein
MQLVIQLRCVVVEYVSGTNIDGRHCDTVMPSTTTERRASTRIEEQTYRARISPPRLKGTSPRQASIPMQSRPVCPNCHIDRAVWILAPPAPSVRRQTARHQAR